jgi:dTDP-4-dehydrorhamnose reductase
LDEGRLALKTLILGRTGQLGWALERRAAGLGDVVAFGRRDLDLANPKAVADRIAAIRPDVVFNAAAYTAVDRAESERDLAFSLNAGVPETLAAVCAVQGALLIHYSTDYVFDGLKAGAYLESDPTAPVNVYGASKLAGEQAIMASRCAAVVLRTAWVYGDHGNNFAKTILRLATERDRLAVVADQHGTPTWAGRLADVSCRIIAQATASPDPVGWLDERRGVYHASGSGATTWAEYARLLISTAEGLPRLGPRLLVRSGQVESIPSTAYPTPAARPANSLLDSRRLGATFGYPMPDWREDVIAFVERLDAAAAAAAAPIVSS